MRKCIVTMAVLAMCVGSATAATVYQDEGDFLAAIGTTEYLLEDFDGYTYGSYTDPTLDLGPEYGYSCTLDANNGGGDPGLWSGDGNMSTNSALNMITATFTGADTYSAGGFFFASEINGLYIPGTVNIELSDGTFFSYEPAGDTDFVGFVSTEPLTWMTIDALDDLEYSWSTMDHFYVDSPEPGSLALLMLGALAVVRRR